MRLTLSVLRCPPSASPETRIFNGGEVSIGRGPDNTWVLPDPDRHLSKRHLVLAYHGGAWQIADMSANGTFLNAEAAPIGQVAARHLRDGDRIRFGPYEVEASLSDASLSEASLSEAQPGRAWPNASRDDPFGRDPFAVPPASEPSYASPMPSASGMSLPPDFDPLAPDDAGRQDAFRQDPFRQADFRQDEFRQEEFRHQVQADHSPSVNDAFQFPSDGGALPDDWADDFLPGPAPSLEPPPTLAPVPAAVQSRAPAVPVPAVPVPAVPVPAPPPGASPGDAALLAAFLRGAGLADLAVADPTTLMQNVGEIMRATVAGLRRSMIARSAVKSEFRIDRTMISARGNNPLKFSADDDDALSALLGQRRSDLPPTKAVADALAEMRVHELATIAAMQSAVRALVAQFDPEHLRKEAEASRRLPMVHKARAWEAFEALHAKVARSLADDFDSVFAKSFARAYEKAQQDLSDKQALASKEAL